MKKLAFSLIAFGATIVMSCGGSSSQREQEVQDSLRQDSIKKVAALNDSLRRDSIIKDSIRQDSMWRYRVTPDLALFNLHGPVKSVKNQPIGIYGDEYNVNFSESGEVKSISSSYKKASFSRGADGKISKITSAYAAKDYSYHTFKYNEKGYPVTTSYVEVECGEVFNSFNATFTYDKDGYIIKESGRGDDIEGDYKRDNSNTILKVDQFGNWTKRKVVFGLFGYDLIYTTEVRNQTRTITYYERK